MASRTESRVRTYAVTVYEIEHSEDLEEATSALRRAGATGIEIASTDFEGAEAARIRFSCEESDLQALLARAEDEGAIL